KIAIGAHLFLTLHELDRKVSQIVDFPRHHSELLSTGLQLDLGRGDRLSARVVEMDDAANGLTRLEARFLESHLDLEMRLDELRHPERGSESRISIGELELTAARRRARRKLEARIAASR